MNRSASALNGIYIDLDRGLPQRCGWLVYKFLRVDAKIYFRETERFAQVDPSDGNTANISVLIPR